MLLDQKSMFFIPFEILLIKSFLNEDLTAPAELKIVTFSTACLSLAFLFRLSPVIGFGSQLVQAFFSTEHVAHRQRHEADLARALNHASEVT